MNLTSKKLIFVTGKGGVGKSACAAAVAWDQARQGRKVCLFELGSESFYESFFETRGIGYEPIEVVSGVHISLLTPENCLREYILHFLKVPKLYDIFFQNKVMKAFMNAAPALAEFSLLGKLTGELRGILKKEYDVYVVDCYSTGHAMALFHAPEGLSHTFRAGPLYDQCNDIRDILRDPATTHYVLVSLPEEMPVIETSELYSQLKKEFNADISVVCNGIIDPPIDDTEQKKLSEEVHDKKLHEFLEYIRFKMSLQRQQLKKVEDFAGQLYGVPQILTAGHGQDYIERFSKFLESPWILKNS